MAEEAGETISHAQLYLALGQIKEKQGRADLDRTEMMTVIRGIDAKLEPLVGLPARVEKLEARAADGEQIKQRGIGGFMVVRWAARWIIIILSVAVVAVALGIDHAVEWLLRLVV